MDVTLENDRLKIVVSTKGVELQSVVCDGVERIWSGDPTVWGRKAPLLFPIIGRLRDGYFGLEGVRQDHPMHGFCRDREFEVVSASNTEAVFRTESDEETLKIYPFEFVLTVRYELSGNTVRKFHTVKNASSKPMPFEVGGHEAYATKLLPGESMSDYYIRFHDLDAIEMFQMDEDGILDIPKVSVPLDEGRLFQTPEELGIDTIILEGVPGGEVTLASTANDYTTTVHMGDFPYLGIWTIAGQDDPSYICIEPWSALPDAHFSPRELSGRAGVLTLQPGFEKTLAYSMSFT